MIGFIQEQRVPLDMQALCWFEEDALGWYYIGYGFEVFLYHVSDHTYQADHVERHGRRLEAVLSVSGGVTPEIMETRIVNELLQRPWLWEGL